MHGAVLIYDAKVWGLVSRGQGYGVAHDEREMAILLNPLHLVLSFGLGEVRLSGHFSQICRVNKKSATVNKKAV